MLSGIDLVDDAGYTWVLTFVDADADAAADEPRSDPTSSMSCPADHYAAKIGIVISPEAAA